MEGGFEGTKRAGKGVERWKHGWKCGWRIRRGIERGRKGETGRSCDIGKTLMVRKVEEGKGR